MSRRRGKGRKPRVTRIAPTAVAVLIPKPAAEERDPLAGFTLIVSTEVQ